jgi:hypothetical protein
MGHPIQGYRTVDVPNARRPALALLLIALLATQGVLASPPKLTDTDQSNRKLMAAQKADIVPALIAAGKAAWKGVVFLGELQSVSIVLEGRSGKALIRAWVMTQ